MYCVFPFCLQKLHHRSWTQGSEWGQLSDYTHTLSHSHTHTVQRWYTVENDQPKCNQQSLQKTLDFNLNFNFVYLAVFHTVTVHLQLEEPLILVTVKETLDITKGTNHNEKIFFKLHQKHTQHTVALTNQHILGVKFNQLCVLWNGVECLCTA